MRGKIIIISISIIFLFSLLTIRLFYWQIIKNNELTLDASRQRNNSEILSAPRGNILASDGSFLALKTQSWRMIADPSKIDYPRVVANKIAPIVDDDPERLESLLSKKGLVWVSLKEKISTEVKKNLEAMKILGIGFEETESRFYPEASSAAQILGFVGKDDSGNDIGYFGLEGYYNLALSGKSGYLGREKDARGSPILINLGRQVGAINGVDLLTSIDKRINILLEKKLQEGIEKYAAKAGSIIVMDPNNGEILGMASYPSFDPREYWKYGDFFFKNPVISDSFEPGSIFKVLVMSSAIDAGVVDPDTKCEICDGPLKIDKYFIKTWNNEYRPDITMTDVIVHSDNVGMSFVGQKLGSDNLYDYLDKFGIGKNTGIDLQGEVSPSLRKKNTWNDVDLATTSFGQGIAVTPIQMIRAVSAVANDGILKTPHVVRAINGDGWQEKTKFDEGVRVISKDAALKMTSMMVEAVETGEAKWTKISGYKVAGKTGTAQIPIAGHYDPEKTNASFIAFAPANNPKFVMLVTLREPQTSPWAAETAAPLWFSIAKELFKYFGIEPQE